MCTFNTRPHNCVIQHGYEWFNFLPRTVNVASDDSRVQQREHLYSPALVSWTSLIVSELVLLLSRNLTLHLHSGAKFSLYSLLYSCAPVALYFQMKHGSELCVVHVNVAGEPTSTAVLLGPINAAEMTCKPIVHTK